MKPFGALFEQPTLTPLRALIVASGICVALVSARVVLSGKIWYAFLIWNLFLAWMPLLFAWLVRKRYASGERHGRRLYGLAFLWLLFFPNAPYIFTDLVHLKTRLYAHFWVDMMLILSCALTGLVLGFVSLHLMQSMVANRFGRVAGWCFVAAVLGLSGFGVFLGRFLRLNSWDVLLNPVKCYRQIGDWLAEPFAGTTPYAFTALFVVFLFMAYMMFYGMTQLPKPDEQQP
jgi:uncharacterized membrane protein